VFPSRARASLDLLEKVADTSFGLYEFQSDAGETKVMVCIMSLASTYHRLGGHLILYRSHSDTQALDCLSSVVGEEVVQGRLPSFGRQVGLRVPPPHRRQHKLPQSVRHQDRGAAALGREGAGDELLRGEVEPLLRVYFNNRSVLLFSLVVEDPMAPRNVGAHFTVAASAQFEVLSGLCARCRGDRGEGGPRVLRGLVCRVDDARLTCLGNSDGPVHHSAV